MTEATQNRRRETPLVLCALLLAVVLGVVVSPIFRTEARAEMVGTSNHLVTLTARGGNEDVLMVLDNRSEKLMIYRVNNQSSADLMQVVELPRLFESARARRAGK